MVTLSEASPLGLFTEIHGESVEISASEPVKPRILATTRTFRHAVALDGVEAMQLLRGSESEGRQRAKRVKFLSEREGKDLRA
jgi:hypothetical protein